MNDVFYNTFNDLYYQTANILFGLPIILEGNKNNITVLNLDTISYPIDSIQYRYYDKTIIYKMQQMRNENISRNDKNVDKLHNADRSQNNRQEIKKNTRIFKVVPDIQNDIYHLYDTTTDHLFDIAYIPDYKTSVMMNSLFRNIKENNNLDALEESDSEEEFENDKIDKFVYLDKQINMICEYNYKFKKWAPIRGSETSTISVK